MFQFRRYSQVSSKIVYDKSSGKVIESTLHLNEKFKKVDCFDLKMKGASFLLSTMS